MFQNGTQHVHFVVHATTKNLITLHVTHLFCISLLKIISGNGLESPFWCQERDIFFFKSPVGLNSWVRWWNKGVLVKFHLIWENQPYYCAFLSRSYRVLSGQTRDPCSWSLKIKHLCTCNLTHDFNKSDGFCYFPVKKLFGYLGILWCLKEMKWKRNKIIFKLV